MGRADYPIENRSEVERFERLGIGKNN